jgi:hypothetical protein
MDEITRESLIKQAQELAAADARPYVLRLDFIRRTGISEHHVLKHFDSWTDFFTQAGLQPQGTQAVEDTELLDQARKAFVEQGGISTFSRFLKFVPHSKAAYRRRWRTWPSFLAAFRDWIIENDPEFPHLAELETRVQADCNPQVAAVVTSGRCATGVWQPTGGSRFGPFLNFRGLQHAPINEQGVVLLFGMVAFEIGYVVESVATGFPDCEAKRRVKGPSESWERIRIEFEFQSKNFLDHGHDPAQCDVIVCWEHNWLECPLEVLELSSAIRDLDNDS